MDASDLLKKEQLKTILGGSGAGGSGGGHCEDECTSNADCSGDTPVCRTIDANQTCPDHPKVKRCLFY